MITIKGNLVLVVTEPIIPTLQKQIDECDEWEGYELEKQTLLKAKAYLEDGKLIATLFIAIQGMRYGSLHNILKEELSGIFFRTIFEDLGEDVSSLIRAVLNIPDQNESEDRVKRITKSFVKIFMPDLMGSLKIIDKLMYLAIKIYKLGYDKKLLLESLPELTEDLGLLLGCDPIMMDRIVNIIRGDLTALKEFIAPFCVAHSSLIETLFSTFSLVKSKFNAETQSIAAAEKPMDESDRMMYGELMKKAEGGSAGIRELFTLVDMEGNKSGGISTHEFQSLLVKLSMNLSQHRVAEIFARVKKKDSKNPNELNFEEFEEAIKYVQYKRVSEGMFLAGLSASQLIFLLASMIIILILLFAFIFLGIVAFALGGSFASVINSLIPIVAGLGVGQKIPIDFSSEIWMKRLKDIVDEVTLIIGGKEE